MAEAGQNSASTAHAAPPRPGGRWAAVVANPFSGAGINTLLVERLKHSLAEQGLGCLVAWDRDERAKLLEQAADPLCVCVVAAGGDGTVADVCNSLPAAPLGVIPLGNENLVARCLGFDRDMARLARGIVRGATRRMDLGLLERIGEEASGGVAGGARQEASGCGVARRFSLMLSAGFDAEVVRRLAQWRQSATGLRRVNRLSYLSPVWQALTQYRYPAIEVVADGQMIQGHLALVCNLPRYGPQLRLFPDGNEADGLFDYLVLRRPGIVALGQLLIDILLGRHLSQGQVAHGQARQIVIRALGEQVPLQADGDPAGSTPVRVSVCPGALTVVDMRGC